MLCTRRMQERRLRCRVRTDQEEKRAGISIAELPEIILTPLVLLTTPHAFPSAPHNCTSSVQRAWCAMNKLGVVVCGDVPVRLSLAVGGMLGGFSMWLCSGWFLFFCVSSFFFRSVWLVYILYIGWWLTIVFVGQVAICFVGVYCCLKLTETISGKSSDRKSGKFIRICVCGNDGNDFNMIK